MNPDTTPTPRADVLADIATRQDGDWEVVPADFARELERELTEKTNEVARLRESLDLYTDIINKQDDELIRLRKIALTLRKHLNNKWPDEVIEACEQLDLPAFK